MIVVLDTNVIVSAALSPSGPPAEIVRRWQAGTFDIAMSPDLFDEVEGAFTYPQVRKYLKLTQEEVRAFLHSFRNSTIVITPSMTLDVIPDDPDDNRVLECAVASRASSIVTGDKHLLELREYEGILVLKPASFLAVLESL